MNTALERNSKSQRYPLSIKISKHIANNSDIKPKKPFKYNILYLYLSYFHLDKERGAKMPCDMAHLARLKPRIVRHRRNGSYAAMLHCPNVTFHHTQKNGDKKKGKTSFPPFFHLD